MLGRCFYRGHAICHLLLLFRWLHTIRRIRFRPKVICLADGQRGKWGTLSRLTETGDYRCSWPLEGEQNSKLSWTGIWLTTGFHCTANYDWKSNKCVNFVSSDTASNPNSAGFESRFGYLLDIQTCLIYLASSVCFNKSCELKKYINTQKLFSKKYKNCV